MTFQTFKNDIKNNNITDFTPYLDVKYTEGYRAEMIKNNILVEESVARKEQLPLIAAIEKGYAKTHYKEWSCHQSASVRTALAKNGYFPTHFLTDKDVTVRTAVCYKHPKLAKDLLTKTHQEIAGSHLIRLPVEHERSATPIAVATKHKAQLKGLARKGYIAKIIEYDQVIICIGCSEAGIGTHIVQADLH